MPVATIRYAVYLFLLHFYHRHHSTLPLIPSPANTSTGKAIQFLQWRQYYCSCKATGEYTQEEKKKQRRRRRTHSRHCHCSVYAIRCPHIYLIPLSSLRLPQDASSSWIRLQLAAGHGVETIYSKLEYTYGAKRRRAVGKIRKRLAQSSRRGWVWSEGKWYSRIGCEWGDSEEDESERVRFFYLDAHTFYRLYFMWVLYL